MLSKNLCPNISMTTKSCDGDVYGRGSWKLQPLMVFASFLFFYYACQLIQYTGMMKMPLPLLIIKKHVFGNKCVGVPPPPPLNALFLAQ